MKVEKWGDGLVVPVPTDVAKALDLKPGDDVALTLEGGSRSESPSAEKRAAAMQDIRELARALPRDWKFDRDEANAR